eukprot:m.191506 g.191506  ORF g.191506 m.191506 type:complete len:227 (+) comp24925_c0_seq1:504-1184(+)
MTAYPFSELLHTCVVDVPKHLLMDRHSRDKIRSVEAELGCHIQVPGRSTPCDPVLVPLAVSGAPLDAVERELGAAFGLWKVVDDVPPALIVGAGGRTIKFLQTLVPECTIHPANKGAMCGNAQDKRTILRGTPEQIEATHVLIRKLHDFRKIVACPLCGETFHLRKTLKQGRRHVVEAHALAADGITDMMMREAGFDKLKQILLCPDQPAAADSAGSIILDWRHAS